MDYDLSLVEIDSLTDRLLHQNMIVKEGQESNSTDDDDDSFVDRSHLDYDALLDKILLEYPNCKTIIEQIKKSTFHNGEIRL